MRKRFTLLELLIVVAVIGILVTLLMPSLAKARQAARNAVCLTNTNQLGKGATLFTSDNSGKYPNNNFQYLGRVWMGRAGTQTGYGQTVTQRPINPYLGFKTNGMEIEMVKDPCSPNHPRNGNYKAKGTTYYGNEHHSGWNGLTNVHVSQINNPTKVVVIRADGTDSKVMNTSSTYWRAYHKLNKYEYPFTFVDGSSRFFEVKAREGVSFEEGEFILNLNIDN